MINENSWGLKCLIRKKKKEYRKSPVVFAFGMRSIRTKSNIIVDFLDMDLENEIIFSVCVNKELAINLKDRLSKFIEDEDSGD